MSQTKEAPVTPDVAAEDLPRSPQGQGHHRGSGIDGCLDRPDIAGHHDGHQATLDFLAA